MSTFTPNRRRRSRRAERADDVFRPENGAGVQEEQEESWAPTAEAPASSEENLSAAEPDWSAYYRRPADTAEETETGEPEYAYAPPVRLPFSGYGKYQNEQESQSLSAEEPEGEEETDPFRPSATVYHPRLVSWNELDSEPEPEERRGYQVEAEEKKELSDRARRKKIRVGAIAACAVLALAGAGYAFRQPLAEWIGSLTGQTPEVSAPAVAVATPAPVRSYDAAVPVAVTSRAREAIGELCGGLELENVVVRDTSILSRCAREDGRYDYYLFSAADGRLLCYFEDLGPDDAFPMAGGGYYVRQSPWLIQEDGSAMLKLDDVETALGESVMPHPMMNGWALLEAESGDEWNYINAEGTLLSPLWLEKAWPMTGDDTLGLVDTGNLNDTETRYTLYVLGSDGSCERWRSEPTPDGVIVSACGMAYLDSGEVVRLSQPEEPFLQSDDVTLYPDCDAMVVRDPESGKYGLYVHGDRQYDFLYDEIMPAESDLQWRADQYQGSGGTAALRYVTGAAYPQPLSHYFRLAKDGEEQYVALSTASACPVELN